MNIIEFSVLFQVNIHVYNPIALCWSKGVWEHLIQALEGSHRSLTIIRYFVNCFMYLFDGHQLQDSNGSWEKMMALLACNRTVNSHLFLKFMKYITCMLM